MANKNNNNELRIYTKTSGKASSISGFWRKIWVQVSSILAFVGALLWLLINIAKDATSIKGGGIIALLIFGGIIIWRIVEFYQSRKEKRNEETYFVVFNSKGISVKVDTPSGKDIEVDYYGWESIAYVYFDKAYGKKELIFFDENYQEVFKLDGEVYAFSKKDVSSAIALAPSTVTEMSDKEYIAHMPKKQKKERTINKIGCIIIVIGGIILLILLTTE